MGRPSPFLIELGEEDRRELERRVRTHTAEQRQVVRANIVLMAASGEDNVAIAEALGVATNTVYKWRKRFFGEGMDGLADRPRSGRPKVFTPQVRAQVKAIACELPAARGAPLSRFSASEIVAEVVESGLVERISASTVARWLAADALRPWRHRSWIFPRDPRFAEKAGVVLDAARIGASGQWKGWQAEWPRLHLVHLLAHEKPKQVGRNSATAPNQPPTTPLQVVARLARTLRPAQDGAPRPS